jgi:hypothetical protein
MVKFKPLKPYECILMSIVLFVIVCYLVWVAVLIKMSQTGPRIDSGARIAYSRDAPALLENSAWDGSVRQVKDWLYENANDADSLEFVEWGPVVKLTGDFGYAVRCKYRAKNVFGGYVLKHQMFRFDVHGNFISVRDLE